MKTTGSPFLGTQIVLQTNGENGIISVTTSSDGLIFVKRRAKDGRFFSKNTGIRRAKRRAKFKLCIKKCE